MFHATAEEEDAPQETTNRPLDVLRVASDTYPEVTGGIGLHVDALSRRQARRGHRVTVLTSDHGNSDLAREERRDGYTLVRHRELGKPLGNSIVPGLARSLRRRVADADLVHAHSHLFFSTNLAALARRVSETPLVITNHGLHSQTAPAWLQSLYIPTVAKFTFDSADRIFCYTRSDRDRLRQRGIETDVDVVPNGIDCTKFAPDDDVAERHEILFVGRLKRGKGLDYLLAAFAQVAPNYPDVTLRVVGSGPERQRYESRCRELGIDDAVTFAGEVPYDEMPRQYNRSCCFALPSLSEGLPRTVLEALACEVPVVTSALPQLESIVDDVGYTVPERSVAPLASAIGRLVGDADAREAMGKKGRERVLERYSWESTVEQTTSEYYSLV